VPIDLDRLEKERAELKAKLRELEQDQRKLEAELKKYRQQELQTKRQIEALGTLIEVQATHDDGGQPSQPPKTATAPEG
jgi:uncharacterized protein YlxW (UPF0749 family)